MQSIFEHIAANSYYFEPLFDGEIHRFQSQDRRDKSGWFIGHQINTGQKNELQIMVYGDWSKNEKFEWCSRHRFSKEEKVVKHREFAKLKAKLEVTRNQANKEAKELAKKYIASLEGANGSFEYLQKKKCSIHPGVKYDSKDAVLVIPLYCDLKKEICSYQTINKSGVKYFLKDGKTKGSLFFIEGSKEKILVCEGYATGSSLHQATGFFTVIAFNANNLFYVIEKISTEFDKSSILLCADNDAFNDRNTGLESAKKVSESLNIKYVLPEFKDITTKPTDFNDLFVLQGMESVKSQVNNEDKIIVEKQDGLRDDYHSFQMFFKKALPKIIHERLSKECKIYDNKDKSWRPVLTSTEWLKSDAHEAGLNRSFVENHLARYIKTLDYQLLYKPVKWDGTSRFEKIFDCLEFSGDGLSKEVCFDLFKWWLSCIPGRIIDPNNQNKIIVLRGPQNIGKDTFCNKVFGTTFKSYYVNIEPTENNKDNFQTIYGKLVANISEFDQTNRMSISSIKNLITANNMRMRLPYAPSPEDLVFHTSFIASSNFENILRDTTGNRRYMIFDVEKIRFEYDEYLNGEQLLAEIYHLYESKFIASDASQIALDEFIRNETPEGSEDLILEALVKIIEDIESHRQAPIRYSDIADNVQRLSKTHGVSVFRIQQIIKRAGLQRKNNGVRYYSTKQYADPTH